MSQEASKRFVFKENMVRSYKFSIPQLALLNVRFHITLQWAYSTIPVILAVEYGKRIWPLRLGTNSGYEKEKYINHYYSN